MTLDFPKFLSVDFYSGAGGTTRGLLDAGGYGICGVDKDESNRITYQCNNPNTTLDKDLPKFLGYDMFPMSPDYPKGQQQAVWDELNQLIPHYRSMAEGVPLLFAICAPCQSFTKFIQRRMTDGREQSRLRDQNLLAQTVDFIKAFQPELVISENVASISSGQYKRIWSDFVKELREEGYAVGEKRVCASQFGVAQNRRRTVLLAFKAARESETVFSLPVPSGNPEASQLSASAAISHLPPLQAGERCTSVPNHTCRDLTEINRQRLMSVRPGEPNFRFSESPFGDLSLGCHRRLVEKGQRGFGDVYTRIHPDRPAPTLTTRFHSVSNGRFGHYDDQQVRGLSLREGAALQSFPDHYEFYGESMDSIARMIGNAVPPKLSAYMAEWLLGLWQESRNPQQLIENSDGRYSD